jgi:hypothetical protein
MNFFAIFFNPTPLAPFPSAFLTITRTGGPHFAIPDVNCMETDMGVGLQECFSVGFFG